MLIIQHAVLLAVLGQSFDATSVRVSAASPRSSVRIDGAQAVLTNVTLSSIIQRAYDVKACQVDGPGCLGARRFDVAAKIPAGDSTAQVNLLFQNLLTERFHLALHHETRSLPGYELAMGSRGFGLGSPCDTNPGITLMEKEMAGAVVTVVTARAQPVSELVNLIVREFRLPVIDKTGLTGNFDFQLEFAPQRPGALPVEAPDPNAPVNLTTAIQDLGLKLNSARIPTGILVIDHADQTPTEN